MKKTYPAGGLLPQGAHVEFKQDDQGKDLATNWKGPIQAPGDWECVDILSNGPFPFGFGPHYPIIHIKTGRFANDVPWYFGHTTAAVKVGQKGKFGDVLAHADQGHNWANTIGGWVEFGQAPGGVPIHTVASWHFFDGILASPLVITDAFPLKIGDSGWNVLGMTSNLRDCGWLSRPYFRFNAQVHGAVVAFKKYHKMHLGAGDGGIVDAHTADLMKWRGAWCKKHHQKEKK